MRSLLLPAGIICLLYFGFFTVKYPRELWLSLSFQDISTKKDWLASCVAWLFLIGATSTVTWLCREVEK